MQPPRTGAQVARFAAVGLVNTGIDYAVFMMLSAALALPLESSWVAKAMSGALAMIGSFALNRRWVFRSSAGGWSQVARFVVVTLIGTFGVQLGAMHLFSAVWLGPAHLAARVASGLAIDRWLSAPVIVRTVAFGLATALSMCWNFLAYRRWVFPSPARALIGARV